ncbi:MAG: hypothetical protein ACMG6S_24030 [Byssovorax sp.]
MRLGWYRTIGFAASLVLTACGEPALHKAESPPAPAVNDGNGASLPANSGSSTKGAPIQQRLQGTWEIARYTSERPIPDSAMPLMAELFDSLRLRFDGDSVSARAGRQAEERTRFTVADERGESFQLVAKGGLFDGARCRFVDADTWEATDHGPSWSGVSLLRRVKR